MTTTINAGGELTGDYVLDPARTRIGFAARAMLLGKVRGHFDDFEGSAHLDGDDPSRSDVRLVIRSHSIQTRNEKRDDHLRGGDFLAADEHPAIVFASTGVERITGTDFRVTGDLTLRGATGPVTVDLRLTDAESDAPGGSRVDFTGRATIDRTDWGITWGRGMIGRKVTLEFEVAATRP
ncbi:MULTISPECIES: YceI family protein [unclassified Streptomyces]|jgi:polyisoprenoid-binding protein YceI|uniref:YceI family protein n=1 Tax=unclassified Streptomyces TaxID=2593676 RepID=UPI000FFF159C|nr:MULTISPECIES: YceI family protein [unclassified Streptomyces]